MLEYEVIFWLWARINFCQYALALIFSTKQCPITSGQINHIKGPTSEVLSAIILVYVMACRNISAYVAVNRPSDGVLRMLVAFL
jgi:hypothetical protein